MKNIIIIFKFFWVSVAVITVSGYDMSSRDVSTMFLVRRLQPENTMCICGSSHAEETEPALEKT